LDYNQSLLIFGQLQTLGLLHLKKKQIIHKKKSLNNNVQDWVIQFDIDLDELTNSLKDDEVFELF
jgi:hypothetical protein